MPLIGDYSSESTIAQIISPRGLPRKGADRDIEIALSLDKGGGRCDSRVLAVVLHFFIPHYRNALAFRGDNMAGALGVAYPALDGIRSAFRDTRIRMEGCGHGQIRNGIQR